MVKSWHIPRTLSYEALRLLSSLPVSEIERRLRMNGPAVPEGREPAAVEGQPSDQEVAELVALIREISLAWESDVCLLGNMTAGQFARAAVLLEQLSASPPLRPIPVSERLPLPEDCDLLGHCWWGDGGGDQFVPSWRLCEQPDDTHFAHWLPASALPLPEFQP